MLKRVVLFLATNLAVILVLSVVLRLVPFTSGEELLIVKGNQLRGDRLRVVFTPDTQVVAGKSLRLATGEYEEDSLFDRVILRAD